MSDLRFISNFSQPQAVKQYLPYLINSVFNNPRCAFIIDTRLSILPEVLPNIEFVHTYEQRVLPLLGNTTAVVSEPFDEQMLEYISINNRCSHIIKIPNKTDQHLTKILLAQTSDRVKQDLQDKMVFPHIVEYPLNELAQQWNFELPCSLTSSEQANNKVLLKQYLLDNGLPTVPGVVAENYEEAWLATQQSLKDFEKVVVKQPFTVSGFGIDVYDRTEIKGALQKQGNFPVIVEGWLDIIASPSVQFFKSGSQVIMFALTDQILDGPHFMGNRMPSRFVDDKDLCEKIDKITQQTLGWLQQCNYEGWGCVDLIVTKDKQVYPVEINARLTAAQFPALTAYMINGSWDCLWENIAINFKPQSWREFIYKVKDLLLTKNARDNGIHPIILGGTQYGMAQILLIARNTHQMVALKNDLRRRLDYSNKI